METTTKTRLKDLDIELDSIVDEKIQESVAMLFNLIEGLSSANRERQKENQRLREELLYQRRALWSA